MTQNNVHLVCAGTALWHRKIPISDDMRIVAYEATMMAKLVIADRDNPAYCRALWTGMDEVDKNGDVPTGYGRGSFVEVNSDSALRWDVRWYTDENSGYRGLFTFTSGTGEWQGVSGEIDAGLEFCTLFEDGDQAGDAPIPVLGFLEGDGSMSVPS
jgi:hypothetical protein